MFKQIRHGGSDAQRSERANWAIVHTLLRQLSVVTLLLLACGGVYWGIEPRAASLADGLWLAFVTASTVGYGDIVPSTVPSRLFSIVVVLLGFAVLSMVTAAIAAALVGTQERDIEREILRDLHREIAAVRADFAALRAASSLSSSVSSLLSSSQPEPPRTP